MKTETKHTPGSWQVRYQLELGGKLTIIAGNFDTPKTLATIEHIAARTEQEANARLIAAAPEMLEALKEFTNPYEYKDLTSYKFTLSYNEMNKLRAVIAKAEGGGNKS